MSKQIRRAYSIDGLAGRAWADDDHMTTWTEGETINPDDLLEEVVIKTLDQPGATLLDHIAFATILAKNIREWNRLGGDVFKKTKAIGSGQKEGPQDHRGSILDVEEDING